MGADGVIETVKRTLSTLSDEVSERCRAIKISGCLYREDGCERDCPYSNFAHENVEGMMYHQSSSDHGAANAARRVTRFTPTQERYEIDHIKFKDEDKCFIRIKGYTERYMDSDERNILVSSMDKVLTSIAGKVRRRIKKDQQER